MAPKASSDEDPPRKRIKLGSSTPSASLGEQPQHTQPATSNSDDSIYHEDEVHKADLECCSRIALDYNHGNHKLMLEAASTRQGRSVVTSIILIELGMLVARDLKTEIGSLNLISRFPPSMIQGNAELDRRVYRMLCGESEDARVDGLNKVIHFSKSLPFRPLVKHLIFISSPQGIERCEGVE